MPTRPPLPFPRLQGWVQRLALGWALCAPLAVAAAPEPPSAPGTALDPAALVGDWQGDLRFLNVNVQASHGGLPVRLHIEPDLSLTGTVGEARIGPSPAKVQAQRIDYRVVLDREPRPQSFFSKKHIVLLVTRAAGGTLDVDVHVKSRFGFDPTMWVAHLPARRAAP